MTQSDPDDFSIAFDYVDPGSYAAFRLLDDPARLRWRPLELRTPGSLPIDPADTGWVRLTETVLSELRGVGFEARTPGRVPLTRKAHELACHSREYDRFDRIHRALFEAHFEAGHDIGRVDVLTRIAAEGGLEPAEVRTVLGVDRYGSAVEEERRRLIELGVRGVPTIWSERARIEGFRGIEPLRADLDDIFNNRDP